MTLSQLQKLPLYMTSSVAATMTDADTNAYILECIEAFFSGYYGSVPAEDVELNNADLSAGEGHVLARYEAKHKLTSDIYIESHFTPRYKGNDYNNTVVCYCSER